MVYNVSPDATVSKHGIIYNSERSIGGVHYYVPNSTENGESEIKRKVQFNLEKKGDSKEVPVLIVESDSIKSESTLSKYGKKPSELELEREKERKEKERLIREQKALERAQKAKEREEKKEKERQDREGYIVNIAGTDVNFMAQGVKKPSLPLQDKIWLDKAQYYFINVKENGVRVGSSPSYTTYEILEALWATAEQHNINPKRFLVQLYTESRFNPNTVGQAGERGIGQFKESTARSMGFDWELMKGGEATYPYQAMAAARYVQSVGESAYNSVGTTGHRYSSKINRRLQQINDTEIPSMN